MEELQYFLKGLVAGILSAYLVIYGLRPSVPYPDFILDFFENKWIFLVLLIINYYVFIWDYRCGVLLLLSIIALIFDYVIFTTNNVKKDITTGIFDFFENQLPSFV